MISTSKKCFLLPTECVTAKKLTNLLYIQVLLILLIMSQNTNYTVNLLTDIHTFSYGTNWENLLMTEAYHQNLSFLIRAKMIQ